MTRSPSFKPLVAAMSLTLASLVSPPALAIDTGAKAPEFELSAPEGKLRLSDFKGQFVYVDFWASWCGPCRQSFPWMNSLSEKFGPRLKVVGISVDKKVDEARQFLKEVPARFAVAFDDSGATPKAYGVKGMPTSLLIAPDGTVVFVHQSFKDSDTAALEAKIRAALEKKQ